MAGKKKIEICGQCGKTKSCHHDFIAKVIEIPESCVCDPDWYVSWYVSPEDIPPVCNKKQKYFGSRGWICPVCGHLKECHKK